MAKGSYLAIMDHDDIAMPERFEKQVEFLDLHPNVGVVGTWYERFPPPIKKSNFRTIIRILGFKITFNRELEGD